MQDYFTLAFNFENLGRRLDGLQFTLNHFPFEICLSMLQENWIKFESTDSVGLSICKDETVSEKGNKLNNGNLKRTVVVSLW